MHQARNEAAFIHLFKETCRKALGYPLTTSLSETDSKAVAAAIFEQTGLVVGAKSLKNYSFYVLGGLEGKKENPSAATLDTLARFVAEAPPTTEAQRKNNESHYPYWLQYRNRIAQPEQPATPVLPLPATPARALRKLLVLGGVAGLLGWGLWQGHSYWRRAPSSDFVDSFVTVAADSLGAHGWRVHHPNASWWNKRAVRPGHLTLYTLPGDNWSAATPTAIQNLLVHRVSASCFSAEVHFSDFFRCIIGSRLASCLLKTKTLPARLFGCLFHTTTTLEAMPIRPK